MARADLLLSLVRAAREGDQLMLRKAVEAMVAEERAQNHRVLADRLEEALRRNGSAPAAAADNQRHDISGLLSELTPRRGYESLILTDDTKRTLRDFTEEHQRADLLKSYNLAPRNRILLLGPPGNGKTSVAEAIAYELMLPLYAARYEGLIGSYLGETAGRVGRLFDWVRSRSCVLFFDEFDVVAKERGDVHETGEIKRVVSSLLLQIDALPPYVVVVTATNHGELLDRAVWRRFQMRLPLNTPTAAQRIEMLTRLLGRFEAPLRISLSSVGRELAGLSFGEVEEFCTDVLRRYVLELPDADINAITRHTLRGWKGRGGTAPKPPRLRAR
jgi:SpoVK/Ycf46/Vps4 family AAA+-type ATPase